MCIIAAKPAGVDMPSEETISTMWYRNSDGAGFMYAAGGTVHIEKGFMRYADFKDALTYLERRFDLKALPMVMHFRIATHGGTKPENCHPFPITDSVGMLKKLKQTTKVGVAHNGIIQCTPRKGISDTMEYVASQLAPLSKAVPKFYKNKYLMQMIAAATESKLAFMDSTGRIYTVGEFIKADGLLYSNTTYKKTDSWRDYTYGEWAADDWELYSGMTDYKYEDVMWLDECAGEYICDEDGTLCSGDFAIGRENTVYEYNYDEDALEKIPGARAYTAGGMRMKFNEKSPLCIRELVISQR